jgi:NAD(P)-dependent dehydrogenase (short-subunit alcohol dehydrogenase family)
MNCDVGLEKEYFRMNAANNNTVALVTGASEGIGRAISLELLREGYVVVLVSRSQEKLDGVLAEVGDLAEHARTFTADLTDSAQVNRLVEDVILSEGKIDILVNNLGRGLPRELIDTTDEEWHYLVNINLSNTFYICRAALPYMRERRSGVIINIASRAGRRGEGAFAAYSALKHGVIGLTRALADSEYHFGIRVNAICPGAVATRRMIESHPDDNPSRWHAPEEVAGAVLYLLSPAARLMNGQIIDMFGT